MSKVGAFFVLKQFAWGRKMAKVLRWLQVVAVLMAAGMTFTLMCHGFA